MGAGAPEPAPSRNPCGGPHGAPSMASCSLNLPPRHRRATDSFPAQVCPWWHKGNRVSAGGAWSGVSWSWAQGSWLLRGPGRGQPELGSGLLAAAGTGRQEGLLAVEPGRLSRAPGTPMMGGGDLHGEFPMPLGQRATIRTTPVKHRDSEGLGAPQRGTAGRERSQGQVGFTVSGPRRAPSFCGHPSPSLLAP